MTHAQLVDIAGVSDVGCVRQVNEDSIGWDIGLGVAILADGMGGHKAGDVASRLAVEGLMQRFRSTTCLDSEFVRQAIADVNQEVFSLAQSDENYARMGTTLVLVCLAGTQMIIAHVGDSRVYRLRAGICQQLTEDHSLMTQLIKEGTMQPDDVANSRYKNVITRALGIHERCKVDIIEEPWQQDDIYLLCSDGLSNSVDSNSMRDMILQHRGDWPRAAQALIEAANQAGGHDNVSAIIMQVMQPAAI